MRATEFLEGVTTGKIVKTLQIGNYPVVVDQHFYDELHKRKILEVEAFRTLDKLPQAKAKLKNISFGNSFWLFDNISRIALGIRVKKDLNGPIYYKLNTAIKNPDGSPPWSEANYSLVNVA